VEGDSHKLPTDTSRSSCPNFILSASPLSSVGVQLTGTAEGEKKVKVHPLPAGKGSVTVVAGPELASCVRRARRLNVRLKRIGLAVARGVGVDTSQTCVKIQV